MGAAPVERPVASAAYSFVRFSGGAVAPYAAGSSARTSRSTRRSGWAPSAVFVGVAILVFGRRFVEATHVPPSHSADEGELVAVGDVS